MAQFLFQKLFHGQRESKAILLHNEVDDITTLATAVTIPEVLDRIDAKRSSVFIVEGATCPSTMSLKLQGDTIVFCHFRQIYFVENFIYIFLFNHIFNKSIIQLYNKL